MKSLLVTGATGFLGRYVTKELISQGHQIYALVRDPQKCPEGCTPLQGDVTLGNLGLAEVPKLDELWHLAGTTDLSKRARKENLAVNTGGTRNVVDFTLLHGVPRLVHVSTAYADTKRNPYEESKFWAEQYVIEISNLPFRAPVSVTIFKPSILVGEYETGALPDGIKPGAFYEFVRRMLRIHARLERIRKGAESKLHLHPWEFAFRIPGDPEATLNLLPVDIAAKEMARIGEAGVFYITNPTPPKLKDIAEWVGETVKLKIKIESKPVLFPWELAFISVASDFLPYLRGEDFRSDLDFSVSVDREYIKRTLAYLLKRG